MKATQSVVREHSVTDKENLMFKAEGKLTELLKQEVDDAVQKRDLAALKRSGATGLYF